MYPDDGDAEVRRLRLMANTYPTRRARRSAESTGWVLPTVIIFTVLSVVIGAFVIYAIVESADDSGPRAVSTPPSTGAAVVPVTPSTGPTTVPSESLIDNARRIKPLEDIEKGDRVLYQGSVCRWMSWDKNINTSTIKCGTAKAFEIQTGRLTPVELRAQP